MSNKSIDGHAPLVRHESRDEYHDAKEESIHKIYIEEYASKPPPPKPRFYRKKKYWIFCSISSAITTIVAVLLAIYVFFPMIAQHLMNQAKIGVDKAQITFAPPSSLDTTSALQLIKRDDGLDPNSTFYLALQSSLSNTGPFGADIKFQNPINVYYNDTLLGNITLPDTKISGGKGALNAETAFLIQDTDFFATFAREMLANENFEWVMKGKLKITALTRTATVNLDKTISLTGMNGFPNVRITSFELPSDAPGGGINVALGTVLVSPSPIGVQLGTINLAISYDSVDLGVVSADNITLQSGDNDILLKGVLKPQSDPVALEKVGVLFSNYVSGKISQTTATGISAAPDGQNAIGWLSQGFESVQLHVDLAANGPMKIISAVNMGYLDLQFNQDSPYDPTVNAPVVTSDFSIPFGFSLNITKAALNITLGTNSTGDFSVIQIPWSPTQSDQSTGKLQFALNNNTLAGIPSKDVEFNDYTYELTASDLYTFRVGGNATTLVQTPLGEIQLGGVTFEVPTSLHGLQFLNSSATIINSLDVTGGQSDHLELAISVTMSNPSDFSISTGNVYLAMMANDVHLGVVTLNNLKLDRGDNTVLTTATFDPKSSDVGQNILSSFVMGKDNNVHIGGFDKSTDIASLADALGSISIDAVLPGLNASLIQTASLLVQPDSPTTNIVNVQVGIANPFTTGLSITKVVSSVSFQGMPIGNIDQDISNNPIVVSGHVTAQSSPLSMTMNMEPAVIALLLRQLAVKSDMDLKPLDALLGMGGFHIEGQEDVTPTADIFNTFNISSYVMDAMKALQVDLQLSTELNIGQYTDGLQFSQSNVAITTDDSVTRLIPIVGQPIVQQIVDGATLSFNTIVLSAPTDTNFKLVLNGAIEGTGPFSAQISFPQGLTVAWQGKTLGSVTMDMIQTKPDEGAQFNLPGEFTVTDQDAMGEFASYLINNKDFVWDIYTDSVSVNALGFTFSAIHMEKFVTLSGTNGFKDAVVINSFDLPSNDPDGGITLTAKSTIKNPSQVGFDLNGVSFNAYYDGVLLGPLGSEGAAVFPPQGAGDLSMKGRLIHQDSAEGLKAVTTVFENYLAANNSIVTIEGASASGPNGEVGWLTAAFKTLKIEGVVLPGPATKPTLIPSVTIKDMEIDFTKSAYSPPASSKQIQAQIKNPFGFPLSVTSLNMDAFASYDGKTVAELKIPDEKATTDRSGIVSTQFDNVPFASPDSAHSGFDSFISVLTSTAQAQFGLSGTANALTSTAAGDLQLNNIGFDVQTSLAGLNNFGNKASILSLDVVGGTSEYIIIELSVSFANPSQIAITIGDISFSAQMNEFNADVGEVTIKDTVINPGTNTFSAGFHLSSTNSKAVSQLLSDYLTNAKVPLTVVGSSKSTLIASLQPALSTIKLSSEMSGIPASLIASTKVVTTIFDVIAKKGDAYVTFNNPLKTKYALSEIHSVITFEGEDGPFQVGHIDYSIPSPLVISVGGTTTSEAWPLSIDADLGQLLELLTSSNKIVNLAQNVTTIVGDGFTSELYYYQDKVGTEIDLELLPGLQIPLGANKAQRQTLLSDIMSRITGKTTSTNTTSDASAVPVPSSVYASATIPVTSSTPNSSSSSTLEPSAETTKEPAATKTTAAETTKEAEKTTQAAQSTSTDNSAQATESSEPEKGHGLFWPFNL
ncbi:hypothetical protein J3Q64DRAFT_1824759 [Phycomyces blakesleeanus]|uniref:Uncharacterized protein n=2 Tax=Phycomyces blakesleeanus TaxID=4837 RepID=A0ABR3ANV2_PHYBL